LVSASGFRDHRSSLACFPYRANASAEGTFLQLPKPALAAVATDRFAPDELDDQRVGLGLARPAEEGPRHGNATQRIAVAEFCPDAWQPDEQPVRNQPIADCRISASHGFATFIATVSFHVGVALLPNQPN
jgi:hypothetical protein